MNGALVQFEEIKKSRMIHPEEQLGCQSWTADNLFVESYHDETLYYTTRWDALCPYIDVSESMLAAAPRPFVVYALPPDSSYGVPINDKYGLVDVTTEGFWTEPRRMRKFRELDNQYKKFVYTETVVPGKDITVDDVFEMGSDHFENYEIDDREVEGFVDYIRTLDVLILQVHDDQGTLVFTDVSVLLPKYNQVYGSFCQWNRAFKNRSPGIYACLQASRWAAKNGYRYYNLGPVDDYGYKSLFVTDFEPIYALILTDLDHPLILDPTSPIHIDFKREDINKIYRETAHHIVSVASAAAASAEAQVPTQAQVPTEAHVQASEA